MEITLDVLHKFVRQYAQSEVKILDSKGVTRKLTDGEPDLWDLATKADRFWYAGTVYSREQFAKLMRDEMLPARVAQIELPPKPKT